MESLEILNGELSPKYDKYNDIYTVNISSDIERLDINYKSLDGEIINIYGNVDLKPGMNKVIVAINNNENINYITLLVNKSSEEQVIKNIEIYDSLEIQKTKIPNYELGLLISSWFIIVIFLFYIFFKRKRNNF